MTFNDSLGRSGHVAHRQARDVLSGLRAGPHLVKERLVQRRVLPLEAVDLLVELGFYVRTLHLELLQRVDSSFYCFR